MESSYKTIPIGGDMKKEDSVKIISITTSPFSGAIFGLGDDERIYEYLDNQWYLI
jgi:hypothetical protein